MVLVAATIISKSGKELVSGEYAYLPPNRAKELFAAFLKLVKNEKEQTANVRYVNNLRYVYQPFESVYALLVTYKQDNLVNDLDRLRLLSEVVREFYHSGDEDGPCNISSELIYAFNKVMSLGHTETVTIDHVKQNVKKYYRSSAVVSTPSKSHMVDEFFESSSAAVSTPSKLHMADEFRESSSAADSTLSKSHMADEFFEFLSAIKSRSDAPPPTDPITVTIEENVNVTLERHGRIRNFEVHGTLSLQLLNKNDGFIQLQVREFYHSGDEDGPCNISSELIYAFNKVMSLGHTETVTIDHVKQNVKKYYRSSAVVSTPSKSHMVDEFFESSSVAVSTPSKLHMADEFRESSSAADSTLSKSHMADEFFEFLSAIKSRSDAPPPTDPITVTIEENVNVTLERHGRIRNFEVHGTLSLQLLNKNDGFIQLQIKSRDNPDIEYKTHPSINNELFSSEKVLRTNNPNSPLPSVESGDSIDLLRWRLQSEDISYLPLNINCCPCIYDDKAYFSMDYEASDKYNLQNVVISVTLPDLRETVHVPQIEGKWRIDSKNSALEWAIDLTDKSNRYGYLDFVVPGADTKAFFPVNAHFSSTSTFSQVKVVNIVPLKDSVPPKFSQRTKMVADCYKVVWHHYGIVAPPPRVYPEPVDS